MDFLYELLTSVLTYLALLCCAGVGVATGVAVRKHKNKKKEAAEQAENA